jgi:uncharacterized protein (DUF1697 family)
MKYAAFFRNINLGRANAPSKTQLEEAFLAAGADSAASFLTNGTLVYSVGASRARKVLAGACRSLQQVCGLKEPAFVRRVDELAELVASDPFAKVDPSDVYLCCVTFFDASGRSLPATPLASRRRDVEVLVFTDGEALSLSRKIGSTPGSPNAFIEKMFNTPASTRVWNTVVRLVDKHS